MARAIDYYFTSISPFSYLGHRAIVEVADRHGAALNIRPINLFGLWKESGAVPLAERAPMRQRYRLIELQRAADWRGLPITPRPAHFPVDPTLADHTIIAIGETGKDARDYVGAVFRAIWVEDRNISEEGVLADLLAKAGHDASAILEAAKSDSVAAIRVKNTEDAIAADAVGVPAYVLDGEPFWGQDRIEYVDRALASGRTPFAVPG
ncbi:2-hydroxychromene-2-carboxylate isomerase [Oricola thermophila]|uniref:2-hydroxychromene-2-carboxylate isomerase n=1 Tax=Oricola thermophila TaxID=2742145 RepID=A0A6N1VIZ8_9HYPH|nr:2-hydroxychromene-2-carboxylate isomerase [Oricola thermophila]QKV19352.1 2-hydroxychromene-2-carboxylate isomerase [Oricola thermophila]